MLFEIFLAVLSLLVVIIIFQFCKCNKIENFDNSLVNEMKNIALKKQLLSTTEEFITQDDISLLEESTLKILSSIQNIKNKLKKKEVDEEIDETLLTELNETVKENDLDEEMDENYEDNYENDEEEDDDVVEGFMERSTHNCHSFK